MLGGLHDQLRRRLLHSVRDRLRIGLRCRLYRRLRERLHVHLQGRMCERLRFDLSGGLHRGLFGMHGRM